MLKHVKNYFSHFGYSGQEWISCECCGGTAVDIAHIIPRSKFGTKRREEQDDINNLMALCRSCHYKYDFEEKWSREEMQEMHNKHLINQG